MPLTLAERETIVRLSRDSSDPMTIETDDSEAVKRMVKKGAVLKHKRTSGGVTFWTLHWDRKEFRWPGKSKRTLSDADKQVRADRMKKARELSKLSKIQLSTGQESNG